MSIISDTSSNSARQHEELGFSVTTAAAPNRILLGIETRWFDQSERQWKWRQIVSSINWTGGVPSTMFFHLADFRSEGIEIPCEVQVRIQAKIEEKALAAGF